MTSYTSPAREQIIRKVAAALEPVEAVRALWMMGSIAFDRLDELSDIDLVLDVRPAGIDAAWDAIEETLESLAPLDYRYEIPQPTWHGHEQRFFHLAGTPQHLLVDAVIMKSGQPPRFDEVERHGTPLVLFDKDGIVVTTHVDPDEIQTKSVTESNRSSPCCRSPIPSSARRSNAGGRWMRLPSTSAS